MKTKLLKHPASIRGVLILLAAIGFMAQDSIAHATGNPVANCRIGAYRLANGSLVDIGATDEAADLRWRREDGTTGRLTPHPNGTWTSTIGWTDRPDGITARFSDCRDGRITFDGTQGKRIPFDITNTRFQGAGVTLAGRLVMPQSQGRVPIVVLVHGSEH